MTKEEIRKIVETIKARIEVFQSEENPEVPISEYDIIEAVLIELFGVPESKVVK